MVNFRTYVVRRIKQDKRERDKSVSQTLITPFTALVCNTLHVSHGKSVSRASIFAIPVTPTRNIIIANDNNYLQ